MRIGNVQYPQEESCAEYYFNVLAEKGILENIFKRIDARRPLALVNKLFYKTVCSVDNSQDIFRARFELDQVVWEIYNPERNIYASVYCSKRILTEIYISQIYLVDIIGDSYKENYMETMHLLTLTLRKISESLKKFTLFSCLLTENQLMFILDALKESKLKELNIVESAIIHERTRKYKHVLKFPFLEKLDLNGLRYGNPDQNECIASNNEMFCFLKSVGENSRMLEDLSVHETFANWMNIYNFNLKHLCIERATPSNIRLANIISYQANYLTMVDFLDCYVMEDVLNEILQLPHLNILKINLEGISLKGFMNISKTGTLTELFLKLNNACSWSANALSMHTLSFLKKLYLDIRGFDVNYIELNMMLNKKIPNLHVIASQHFVLDCIFSSTFISELQTCTIEIYIDSFRHKKLLTRHCQVPRELKEFTLINRNTKFANYDIDLSLILDRCLFLQKLRIEGLIVNEKLFETAIKNHHYLEEVYLIGPNNVQSDFVFDKINGEIIMLYGKRLRIMEITCAKSKLKSSKQFPFISRRGSLKIFRQL